jgi:ferredoxin--NADP+ reductase
VLRSIGYRGVPLPGVPFDARRAVVPNDGGRVLEEPGGAARPGEYVTGWIKRGPTGVIGTNKKDANETVAKLLEDLEGGRLADPPAPGREAIDALLADRGAEVVTQQGWEAIDAHERERGEPDSRPRAKLPTFEELLERAREADPAQV